MCMVMSVSVHRRLTVASASSSMTSLVPASSRCRELPCGPEPWPPLELPLPLLWSHLRLRLAPLPLVGTGGPTSHLLEEVFVEGVLDDGRAHLVLQHCPSELSVEVRFGD